MDTELVWESPHRFVLSYGSARVVGIIDDIQTSLARGSRYIVRLWADEGASDVCIEIACPTRTSDRTRQYVDECKRKMFAAAEYGHRAWLKA